MKAVIPAAGFGTRFLPATKAQPKEMLPVFDKPTIQYVIEEAVASGIDDILIVTGRNNSLPASISSMRANFTPDFIAKPLGDSPKLSLCC